MEKEKQDCCSNNQKLIEVNSKKFSNLLKQKFHENKNVIG